VPPLCFEGSERSIIEIDVAHGGRLSQLCCYISGPWGAATRIPRLQVPMRMLVIGAGIGARATQSAMDLEQANLSP